MASNNLTGYGQSRLYFDGDEANWEQFEVKMLAYMRIKKLKSAILPGTIATADKKEEAYSELVQMLDPRSLSLIMRDGKDDGRKSLEILRQYYVGTGVQRVISLWNSLSTLHKQRGENLTDYILRAETYANSLRDGGEVVSDAILVAMVTKGLPQSHESFVMMTLEKKQLTWMDFKVSLRNHEENQKASLSHIEESSVMKSRVGRRNSDRNGGTSVVMKVNEKGGGNKKITCYNCRETGHKAAECTSKRQAKMWCSHCRMNNHTDKTCNRQQQQNKNNGGTGGKHHAKVVKDREEEEDEDEIVSGMKHTFLFGVSVDSNYFTKSDESNEDKEEIISENIEEGEDKLEIIEENYEEIYEEIFREMFEEENFEIKKLCVPEIIIDDYDNVHDKKVGNEVEIPDKCCVIKNEEGGNEKETEDLMVDCGATAHIVNEDKNFIEVDKNYKPEEHFIELADGRKVNNIAKMKGTVSVSLSDESGNVQEAQLEDTLFIPSFPQNIFSVRAAAEKGATVTLKANSGELVTANGLKFPIKTVGRLYYLNMCKSTTVRPRVLGLQSWHRILGHVNKRDLLRLEGVVNDMKITNKTDFQCTTCILSKQTVPQNREPDQRATTPMEFVHSDLCGPITPTAMSGFKYAMNYVDDYTSATFVYFLKKKSDAVFALRKFLADSAPYGTVKRLRTDNGGEYVAGKFEEMLTDPNRIKHEFSCPDSPHQNGTAERNWRTIFEMARGMIIESKLPKYLWAYAVMAAVHIRNRVYHPRIEDTPYNLLMGKKPKMKELHAFGTVCFASVKDRSKLDKRAKEGIFVGYDKSSPAYLVYYPEQQVVSKHRVVTFTEKFKEEYENEEKNKVFGPKEVSRIENQRRQYTNQIIRRLESEKPVEIFEQEGYNELMKNLIKILKNK